ncbi:MAG: murein biosynthesis integral membrane protein MurJ [Phycisphaerae bacterium]|jgi:putative peptidoglycan lipid II flippase
MVKGFRQIAVFTVASRVLGFIRDMLFAYFLGAGALFDGWAIAFKIPNLARRIFGEGALSASFIPIYSEELHRRPETADKLASTVVSVLTVVLTGIVILGEAIIWGYYLYTKSNPETAMKLELAGIMLPHMLLICIVAILGGILNTHRHFAAPALSPMVLNIFIIASLTLGGWFFSIPAEKLVYITAVSVILAAITKLGMQFIPLHSRGIHIRPSWEVQNEQFKKIIMLMLPMMIGLTATQINTLADDFIALWFSGSPEKGEYFLLFGNQIRYPMWAGSVSHLYYSQRLYQFPLGVLGISLATAIFPVMSADAARGDAAALAKTISRGMRGAIFIAIPATAGMILVSKIIIRAAFEHGAFSQADTEITSVVLIFYSLGLCGYFLQQIVTRAFYSLQNSKLPAQTAGIAVIVNLTLNLTLIWFMGAAGLALSTAVCSYLQVAIMMTLLSRRYEEVNYRNLLITITKSAVSSGAMFIAGIAILHLVEPWPINTKYDVLRLLTIILPCAAVYIATALLLKTKAVSLVIGSRRPGK